MSQTAREAAAQLREYALGLPGAYEEHPWGERVAKVNKKVFVFMGKEDEVDNGLAFGVKLPISGEEALKLPFTEPAGYGLGKSGWVAVRFMPDETPPMGLVLSWVEESYRAIAPKKLVAQLDQTRASG